MRKPSELEGAVLGILAQEGPCTAYAVRSRFLASPSPQWSGSAGAIYPLVERLERQGLVTSRAQKGTRRKGRLYRLTGRGRRLLREWLAPPVPEWAIGVPPDPLRTRLGFFASLAPEERDRFVDEARQGVDEQLRRVRLDLKETGKAGDPWRHLVARGALASLRARKAWLAEVGRALGRRSSRRG